jgi:uncharacterized protein
LKLWGVASEKWRPLLRFGNATDRNVSLERSNQAVPPDNVIPLRPPRPCPICGKPSAAAFRPFCSARCADVDLNRWLSGAYVIPAREHEAGDADDSEAPETARDDDFET